MYTESERSIRAQRLDAWIDIFIGVVISTIWFSVTMSTHGINPPPLPSLPAWNLASSILDAAAPTMGDWLIIIIITSYAEIWAVRLVSKAITTLRYTTALTIPESSGERSAKV